MDEEVGVKVTRLRRRLSVEAEGTQSPATPSTPTKKRATRLAKPALELITENVTENVPKRATRKSVARDVAEPVEDKTVTPSRRSARIRSNTSLVLETTQNVVDSPRAKRATRRTSQLGSDTETTTTPARQNRRTRKESTDSVELIGVTNLNEKGPALVAAVIVEEPEKEITKESEVAKTDNQSPSLRKSPRLNKNDRKSTDEAVKEQNDNKKSRKSVDEAVKEQNDKAVSDTTKLTEKPSSNKQATTVEVSSNADEETNDKLESKDPKGNISLTSATLINEIDSHPKMSSVFNKTTSAIEEIKNDKNNRKRTKSWTTITNDLSTEKDNNHVNLSSGDSLMKNYEKRNIGSPNRSLNKSALVLNTSAENKENINYLKTVALDAGDTVKLLEKAPGKDIRSMVFIEDSDSNCSSTGKLTIDLQIKPSEDGQYNDGEDQCVPVIQQPKQKKSTSESFTVEPMDIDETIPGNVTTINDFSDRTNSSREESGVHDSKRKSTANENSIDMNESSNKSKRTISLQHEPNNSKRKSSVSTFEEHNGSKDALNTSDRSLSDKQQRTPSILENEDSEKPNEKANKSKRKSSQPKIEDSVKVSESVNTSKRKSVSESESQSLEKSSNENKSTLVLSQLKDVSTNEISSVSKSPNDTNNELSKSVNVPAKETDNKLLSLNYLTSTPLQQKPLQKIAMQINTSIISPNAESKNTTKDTPKKRVSDVCQDSNDDSDEDSKENSKMIDNEAEEASSNYESGDSRSDAERQYEDEHEIVEKGETLESGEELSDDSDYEKDSFIVSSDEEDGDLLSGSGDDLALSDNELKMATKSKKKFDERKRKEQKKASKEMYEARHKLNESDKNSKSKTGKSKRQRLESSLLESETEDLPEPKKKNRPRIDSSQDSQNNSDADESISIKKKKVKRLSSVCGEDTDHNEKEITICNQSTAEKNDPLSIVVKQEPKTPQKTFNMSTVLITDNIEEVQVDTNASLMKSNETSDPLQDTLAQGDEESDSDISENMEIKENYDSVLENLNKSHNKQKKIKTVDTSLNLNKMTKDKIKEPIVDQLNLTQAKKSKKSKAQAVEKLVTSEEQQPVKEKKVLVAPDNNDDDDVSDSIDMRLLFPEDSNDSDINASKFKNVEKQNVEPVEEFIPLKRTPAKTNIRENMDLDLSYKNESEPNDSKKNNSKRKSSQYIPEPAVIEEPEDTYVGFFIDTKGTFADNDAPTQNSAKKNKKKHKHNLSVENDQNDVESKDTLAEVEVAEETSLNVSVKSDKKKKNKSLDVSQIVDNTVFEETPTNVSLSSDKKKKKKNKSFEVTQIDNNSVPIDASVNVSLDGNKKKKKKNKSFDVSDTTEPINIPVNVIMNSYNKKKKLLNDFEDINEDPMETSSNVSLNIDKKNKKKNKSFNISQIVDDTESIDIPENVTLNSDKKKKNKTLDDIQIPDNTAPVETPANVSLNKKKKKNKSFEVTDTADDTAPFETPVDVAHNSEKKKKKKNKSFEITENDNTELVETPANVSQNSDKKKKKKNKSFDVSETIDYTEPIEIPEHISQSSDKKKKKNKSRQTVDNTGEESDEAPLEVSYKSEKKSDSADPVPDGDAVTNNTNKYKKNKKKNKNKTQPQNDTNTAEDEVSSKKRKRDATFASSMDAADDEIKLSKNEKKKRRKMSQNDESAIALSEEVPKSKPKKRKAAETDDGQKQTKMFKENSFDKIHVPRLPENIVNQLDEKPHKELKKQKKTKAISTMPFVVEEAMKRKNKPSNYLEQSIYLNDTPVKKKQKALTGLPKVLPSIPTVITSGKGYTSKFQINVLPQEIEFVAQASNMSNFKNEFLSKQRIKKLGTFERFKKQRNHKISKF